MKTLTPTARPPPTGSMDMIHNYLNALWDILLELAPWLLFGLLLAGVLHVLLPTSFIRRHLGRRRFSSVLKAVAVGVPLPLCSCGVIPTAIGLKRDGASDGAAAGFLISTPQTGLDSILVSASFLGLPFALFKVVSALVSGLVGGILVNLTEPSHPHRHGETTNQPNTTTEIPNPPCCCHNTPAPATDTCCHDAAPTAKPCFPPTPDTTTRHWHDIFRFGLIDLLGDFYRWLIIGTLAAALITTFVPPGRLETIPWTQGLPGMIAMLLVSLPLYICATASVPLAASLVVAGMAPGSALVLLMAGPTTNIATMGAILHTFGKRVLALYLATVATMSITLGLTFDWIIGSAPTHAGHIHPLPDWLNTLAALTLLTLIAYHITRDLLATRPSRP